MDSERAFPEQLPDMTLNRGVSGSDGRVMHFPTPGPVQQSPQEPFQLPSPVTSVFGPGSPRLLSPFTTISPVTGGAGHGPRNPEPGRVIIQVAPEAELLASAVQPAIQPPFTPNWAAARSLPRCAGYYPAPLVTTPVQITSMSTTASSVTQAVQGGVAPQTPPPVTQVGPSVLPSNSGPLALWLSEDIGVAPAQSRGPREDSCSSQSVYQNLQHWQRYKPLAQIYLPQTPDTEALACFFIPVLRSLGRLKPTITLEEGLGRAMWEWQRTKNYERMAYYDMAAKFMEFEAEEEMHALMLQCSHGEQGLQSPTSPMSELQGASLPTVGQQPVCVPRNAGPHQIHADEQQLPRTQAPPEIPPEAVQEYIEIMNELLKGPALEEARNKQEEGPQPWFNSNVLSYVDELCSQENFVTQAEAIIQPRFLDHLLSPDPQLDISALAEELEGVEGLIPSQLADEHNQALHEDQAGKVMTPKDSRAEEIAADHGALSPTQAHRRGASKVTCVPTSRSGHPSRPIPPDASLVSVPTLESRADHILGQDRPGTIMPGSTEGASEEKALSSLASLLASQPSLEPCGVPLRPAPASSPQSTRSRARARTRLPSRRAIQTSGPNPASSPNHRVGRGQGSGPTEQIPRPEAPPRMPGEYKVTFVPDSPTLNPKKRALSSSPARATGPCCRRGRGCLRPRPPQRRAFQFPGPAAAPSKRRRVCVGPESGPARQIPRSEETRIQYRGVTVELDGHTLPLDRLQPVVVLRRIKIPGLP